MPLSCLGMSKTLLDLVLLDSPTCCRGKVFVFSGILPICQTDDGLAAVLGHEIAHNVAHHAAERMSQMALLVVCLYPLAWVIGAPDILSQVVLDFGFLRPGSRKQEVCL